MNSAPSSKTKRENEGEDATLYYHVTKGRETDERQKMKNTRKMFNIDVTQVDNVVVSRRETV